MHLSKKLKKIAQFLTPFLKAKSNFKQFKEMTTLISFLFSKLHIAKDLVRPMS